MPVSKSLNEFLQDIGTIVASEAADVLSTVINKEISIGLGRISETDSETLAEEFSEPVLSIRFNLSPREDDVAFLAINQPFAAQLASLMMTEAETTGELTDAHIEAIRDMAEQVLATLGIPISEKLSREVKFGSIRAEVMDMKIDFPPLSDPVSLSYTVKIGEDEGQTVVQIAALETLDRFEKGESSQSESGEEIPESKELLIEEKGDDGGGMAGLDMEAETKPPSTTSGMEDIFGGDKPAEEKPMQMPESVIAEYTGTPGISQEKVELLLDLSLPVSIELGRTKMLIKDILELGHGSVIEFDKLAGEPVDLLIYDKKVAEGEVVVIDEHFGIRLTNIIKQAERIKTLGK